METQQETKVPQSFLVHWSQILFVLFAWLYVACIIVQVFLAGLGIFVGGAWWSIHVTTGRWFNPIPIILIVLAFTGRFRRSVVVISIILFVQYELQIAFIELANNFKFPLLAAFHPVNAVIMFWLTVVVARQAQRFIK